LLRTAAVIRRDLDKGWVLPDEIPSLVSEVYSDDPALVPADWLEACSAAAKAARVDELDRQRRAAPFLLGNSKTMTSSSLDGLHEGSIGDLPDEGAAWAVVRDGPMSVEVLVVQLRGRDRYTLAGRRLTRGDVLVDDDERAIEQAAGSLVRLPAWKSVTRAALACKPPGFFELDSDLSGWRVLELGEDGTTTLGGAVLTYDRELGLLAQFPKKGSKR
ncbi:MAG: hypothetical protein LBE08_05905, partial [Bifidobacteriaceae bacterium]|jgi:hypothetical protein|nr:hypothetical protein [Bifidobacteriaceae bacterium]